MQYLSLKIIQIVEETADCKSFYFDNQELNYDAGQFLSFIFESSGRQIRRAYSLCTSPSADKFPGITVKRVANGFASRLMLDTWKVGMVVRCLSPAGKFILPAEGHFTPLMFAAGSGIVPIFSMLKEYLYQDPMAEAYLHYSNQSPESAIFRSELENMQTAYPNLKVKFFYSNAFNIGDARMSGAYLDQFFDSSPQSKENHYQVYSCGPETYMYLCEVSALRNGIQKAHFHTELYWREEATSHPTHKFAEGEFDVEIRKGNTSYKISVPGNKTILRAARENNIELPWSCEGGRCSTCQMRLVSGKIYMTRNEVLTNKDINKGLVLTCTGYPMQSPILLETNQLEM